MRKKISYGWWIVLATNLICMVGSVFDATGSYRISFLVTGLLTFCAAIAMFFARPAKPPEELDAQPA